MVNDRQVRYRELDISWTSPVPESPESIQASVGISNQERCSNPIKRAPSNICSPSFSFAYLSESSLAGSRGWQEESRDLYPVSRPPLSLNTNTPPIGFGRYPTYTAEDPTGAPTGAPTLPPTGPPTGPPTLPPAGVATASFSGNVPVVAGTRPYWVKAMFSLL